MKKAFLFIPGLFLLNSTLSAQNIKGVLSDSQNHAVLSFSTVALLKAADSSRVKAVLTDDKGMYHFENVKAGNYLLAGQTMGYDKKLIPFIQANEDQTINITLLPQAKQLNEVTVKSQKPLIEHRADRTVFNVENSIVATGNNGLELLRMTPLVTINQLNGISLKGKANVMIMLDGKIVPAETVTNLLQSLSAEQITKIELITSPSAKYDASATGGIINIITKKGTGMGLNGMANLVASRSHYNRYSGGLSLNYRNNRFNIYGNINLRDSKSYKNENLTRYLQSGNEPVTLETPTEVFGHGKSETGKLGVDYTLNKTSVLGVAFDGLFSQSDSRATAISSFRNAAGRLDSVLTSASRPGSDVKYTSYDLNYKNKINVKGEELVVDLTHSRYSGLTKQELMAQMAAVSVVKPSEEISSDNRTRSLFNITTFQTDYTLPLNSGTMLETGVKEVNTSSRNESTNQDVNMLNDALNSSNTSYKENILAGYLNMSRQLKSLKLQAGLRAEQTNARLSTTGLDMNYLNLFPNALIEKKFSDKYQLSLSYSSRINRPDYESLIPFVVPIDRYTQEKGNADLKPEYANSFELTGNMNSILVTVGYTHTHNAIVDFIEQDLQTKVWTFTKNNFRKMENFNTSVFIPVSITSWWSTNNTLMGSHNSYASDDVGGAMYNRGRFSYTISSIQTFLLPKDIKAELNGSYNSSNIYGLYEISHTSMINLGLSKAFLEKKLNIKFGMNDIFHTTGYHIKTDAGSIRLNGFSYTDSRRATLSVSYKFGKKIAPAAQRTKGNETEQGRLRL